MKKQLSVLLACLLLLPLLASCAADVPEQPDSAPENVSEAISSLETTMETEPEGPASPELTYDGDEIRFLTEDWRFGDIYDCRDIYAEGLDGTLINDAVYTRNMQVEDRFDIHITQECLPLANEAARTAVTSGDTIYDIVMPYLNASTALALEGLYQDLFEIENLHLENKWWDQNANTTLTINGKLYFSTGDISVLDNDCMLVLFFNKDMIRNFTLDSPYELVKEGTWTLDSLIAMNDTVASDIDGDGVMDPNSDRFGLYAFANTPHALFFGTGEKIVGLDEEGHPQLVMYNERSVDAINRIMEFCLADNVMRGDYGLSEHALMEGRLLFGAWALTEITSLRDSEADFGVLPMPKLNETQSRYYCFMSTGLTPTVSIPITNSDPGQAGLILEAMAYYSVDTLTHAYYDLALNSRYIRDEESSEMFDIIFASTVYDFGWIFDVGGLGSLMEGMFNSNNNYFSSTYKASEKRALRDIETIFGASGN